jgi:hypothetical protein
LQSKHGLSFLCCIVLHCTAFAWHARDGGRWPGRTGRKAAFPPVKSSSATPTEQGRRDAMQAAATDAVRDDCEVFSYSGVLSMQEPEPGASFQTIHTTALLVSRSLQPQLELVHRKQPAIWGGDTGVYYT